jgi:hypothetical protein
MLLRYVTCNLVFLTKLEEGKSNEGGCAPVKYALDFVIDYNCF